MKRKAFKQAEEEHRKAARLAHQLSDPKNHSAETWGEFLNRFNRVFLKLIGGANKSDKEKGWSDRLKNSQKVDPMLSYLLQARNAEEHGVEDVSSYSGQMLTGPKPLSPNLPPGVDPDDALLISPPWLPYGMWVFPPKLRLVPVENRGVTFDLPETHLGQPIDGTSPQAVAARAMVFATERLEEARGFLLVD